MINRTMTIGGNYPINTTIGMSKLLGFNEGIGNITKNVIPIDELEEIINNIKNNPTQSSKTIIIDSLQSMII